MGLRSFNSWGLEARPVFAQMFVTFQPYYLIAKNFVECRCYGDQVVRLECNKHLSEHWPGFKTPGIERSEAHKAYWKTCKSATTAILEKNLTEMEKNISLSAANYLRGKSINRNDIACYNVQTNNFAEQFMNIADDQVCIFPLNRTFISLQFLTIDFSFLLFMFYLIIILLFYFLF